MRMRRFHVKEVMKKHGSLNDNEQSSLSARILAMRTKTGLLSVALLKISWVMSRCATRDKKNVGAKLFDKVVSDLQDLM